MINAKIERLSRVYVQIIFDHVKTIEITLIFNQLFIV